MYTIKDLVASIMRGELDKEIRTITESCEARLKLIKQNTLVQGAKVRVGKIRPSYVTGAIGTIVTMEDDFCTVDLDAPAVGPLVKGRRKKYQFGVRIPISCLSAIGDQVNFRKH